MSETTKHVSTRREFLGNTGRIAAATTLAGLAIPRVHAAEDNTLQVALIGCGGRGTGAAADAMSVKQGPVKLVAAADVFENRVRSSVEGLKKRFADQVDVPQDRQFVGFDGYRKAIDCLKPGDIAIFASPLAFRWVHFGYAIQKGLHVFMEKPVTADGPTSRRMIEQAKEATAKNLKVGVGLMSRHARHLQELQQRIQDGEIGDVIAMRGYRMAGPLGSAFSEKWPGQPNEPSELLWQIKRFHSFIWASGGCFNDFNIHIIDHLCWMKNAWPVKAQAVGGRHYRGTYVDQNFDSYAVEYTFADGAKLFMDGRNIAGCTDIYSSYVHGSKGLAIASKGGDCGAPSSIHKGQNPDRDSQTWQSQVPDDQRNPYVNEWNDLVDAIRADKPYNEAERGVMASAVTSLGRKAAHTGREITLEDMLNSDHEYAPDCDKWTMDSPPPLKSDADGKYPIPQPGIITKTEF
ncbi:MAG TPA: Gfo/Idh/MocA family oxidoreductase [Candidatus Anammoximicrobium sp.]|nr:Gfo/Idh/MocA family oxidoreductase [Candidatus Anammoximicrobium sp.]